MAEPDDWKRAIEGYESIRSLHEQLRAEISSRWNRSLPFADELFDRWERAAKAGFGEGTSMYDACLVIGDVKVGAQTWIGPFTVLDGSGGLRIGGNCSISAGVQIYTHDTVAWALTGGKATAERSPVTIGDCTYVGPSTIVTRGVTIGSQCVVGAGSLVNRDLPDRVIAYGTPAKIVGRVEVDGDRIRLIQDEKP